MGLMGDSLPMRMILIIVFSVLIANCQVTGKGASERSVDELKDVKDVKDVKDIVKRTYKSIRYLYRNRVNYNTTWLPSAVENGESARPFLLVLDPSKTAISHPASVSVEHIGPEQYSTIAERLAADLAKETSPGRDLYIIDAPSDGGAYSGVIFNILTWLMINEIHATVIFTNWDMNRQAMRAIFDTLDAITYDGEEEGLAELNCWGDYHAEQQDLIPMRARHFYARENTLDYFSEVEARRLFLKYKDGMVYGKDNQRITGCGKFVQKEMVVFT